MEAAGGMSGGKRNHEDLSDMMALVEAACKVLAITNHRPTNCAHSDVQPVRSAIEVVAELRVGGAERHERRERLSCVAEAVSVCVTASRDYGNGTAGPQRKKNSSAVYDSANRKHCPPY